MESLIFQLIIWGIFAYWCYRIAKKNGRDGGWATVWGILGGIFAVIIYFLIGATKEVKLKRAKELIEEENKR